MQSSQRDINWIWQHLSEALRSDSSDPGEHFPYPGQVFLTDQGKRIQKPFWGQGVVVRNMDDGLEGDTLVVPGTFWHDDIWPPNQIYPWGADLGKSTARGTNIMDGSGAWLTPTLAVAIGPEHFYGDNGIFNFPDLQDADWHDGVWYAHDSNSCDQRALYCKGTDGSGDFEIYDCPGAWVNLKEETPGNRYTFIPDTNKRGSGYYLAGNPDGYEGGGTGMHVRWNYSQVLAGNPQYDYQINGYREDLMPHSLFADMSCQIDYFAWNLSTTGKMKDSVEGWHPWIKRFREGAEALQKPVCAWAADLAIGWMNNPRPMITLQNALWMYREEWCDSSSQEPSDPNSFGHFWGWNEIPFPRDRITNKDNCTCYVIVLPPIEQWDITLNTWLINNPDYVQNLIEQLDTYENSSSINFQSGVSQVLVVKQIPNYDSPDPANIWKRWFCIEEVEILGSGGHGWKIGENGVIQKC
jgi:hypothetical protein